ncbi:MAG: HAD-IA family hydrolase [Atopobiaceae bacterium]
MEITGAIFDCDGTLLDSMPMWHEVTVRYLADLGVADPEWAFHESEHINMRPMCDWWHERLHVGTSGQELYQELVRRIEHEYRTSVKAFPHAREFLEQLRQAGVRMILCSSTIPDLVRIGLKANGLDGYFSGMVPPESMAHGMAHGKDTPDAYVAALQLVGTPRESTLVFEDAPFALRSAQEAGLVTVALLNDHDGRDPRQVASHADILVHGYAELSLALIRNYQPHTAAGHRPLDVLVVDGSPQASSAELVRQLAQAAGYTIAVDRGAEALHQAGIKPDLFCGDSDSVSSGDAGWASKVSRDEVHMPSEKYVTDLGLAIWCARNEATRQGRTLRLTLTCATGGRPDHALGVLGLLAQNADACPRVVEDDVEWRILSPDGASEWQLRDSFAAASGSGQVPSPDGDEVIASDGGQAVASGGTSAAASCNAPTFSVVALRPNTVVSETGARWNLDHRELDLLGDMGISNVATGDTRVECHSGIAVVYLLK